MKNFVDNFLGAIVGIGLIALLYLGISALAKYVDTPSDHTPSEVTTPEQEEPVTIPTEEVPAVELLSTPYIPPPQPFAEGQYKATAPRMILSGSFLSMDLIVRGGVQGEGSRYLILNVNGESGVINATRESTKRLDIEKTSASGGIFTKDTGISTSINLMSDHLGTTGTEFSRNGGVGSHLFEFIDEKELLDVIPIVVVPFKHDGQYGGASIASMLIEYECKEPDSCYVNPCPTSKSYSSCINDVFGSDAMNEWLCRKYGKNCSL